MNAATSVTSRANPPPVLDVKHDTNLFVNVPECDLSLLISTRLCSFLVVWCDNIGLVSLILSGCEVRVLYHCTMCTRHLDLVSLDLYAIPIFPILIFTFTCLLSFLITILNLLIILLQVSSNATSSKKLLRCR